jgi:hypothetical protein
MRRSKRNPGSIGGIAVHVLVAGLMLFAGSGKFLGFAPADIVRKMDRYGLGGHLRLIGFGEMISALLLLIPLTMSLGTLLVSAFWGGVICIHWSHGDSIALPVWMLLLTWMGAALREPRTLASFYRR